MIRCGNAALTVALAFYFLLLPGLLTWGFLADPALETGEIPRLAWRLHRCLTPRYERWARERVAGGQAARVHHLNVPATEWPLFGSVFYLLATESLQAAWERDPSLAPTAPAVYARNTIDACRDLLLDPNHHSWVATYWGETYWEKPNVFFRSLVIAGLTSYQRLTGDPAHQELLAAQADDLARQLNESPFGVLEDYPGECYPIDVFAAAAWIARSGTVTGRDYAEFLARERRAFTGDRLDDLGLIPWQVDPDSGRQYEPSRGIVNAHILIFAPDIYPDLAADWYRRFEDNFWQSTWYGAGYREFSRDDPRGDWAFDVDSGPLFDGFSPAANAFAIAAARANGRLDQARVLAAQTLAVAWPLPGGGLLTARALSDRENAPYLGEAAILWFLTTTPAPGVAVSGGGRLPPAVYLGLAIQFGGFLVATLAAWLLVRRWRRKDPQRSFPWPRGQLALWLGLLAGALALFAAGATLGAVFALLAALLLPRPGRRRPAPPTERKPLHA